MEKEKKGGRGEKEGGERETYGVLRDLPDVPKREVLPAAAVLALRPAWPFPLVRRHEDRLGVASRDPDPRFGDHLYRGRARGVGEDVQGEEVCSVA